MQSYSSLTNILTLKKQKPSEKWNKNNHQLHAVQSLPFLFPVPLSIMKVLTKHSLIFSTNRATISILQIFSV